MAKSLERILGVRVYAYDPDFGVYEKETFNRPASIPLWLAKRIVESEASKGNGTR